MPYTRLVSVDPSLTCSGWAIFDIDSKRLLAVGKIESLPSTHLLSDRYADFQQKINVVFDKYSLGLQDVLVCEGETTMRDPRAALKVEHVRSIFESIARERGVVVPGRINPRTVQSELLGLKGKQPAREVVKEVARHVVSNMYDSQLCSFGYQKALLAKNQDIVDAILIGEVAIVRIKSAALAGDSLASQFAVVRQRRRSRRGWGKGGDNNLGWTDSEIQKITTRNT